jgi:prepilin-type processing-associated H-X9-DG protein
MILPLIDQGPLYNSFNANVSIEDPANLKFRETYLPVFACPSDTGPGPKWDVVEEDNPGTTICSLASANYVGAFGTMALDECENAPGTTPVLSNGQCAGDGAFYHNSRINFRDLIDGTSNTIFVGERLTKVELGWHSTWVGSVAGGLEAPTRVLGSLDHTPNDPVRHFDDFSSYHTGGAHYVLGDGHVKFVSSNIDKHLYQSLGTIKGGEITGEF